LTNGKVFDEDAQRPRESYEAVFSASAIHWVDPDLSWRKIADALAPGGTLALIQYFGLKEQRSVDDQEALCQPRSSTPPLNSTPCSARCHSGHDSHASSATPSPARITLSTSAWGGQSGRARSPCLSPRDRCDDACSLPRQERRM
jgi:hypothetical protein